jgi:hypothetical protein
MSIFISAIKAPLFNFFMGALPGRCFAGFPGCDGRDYPRRQVIMSMPAGLGEL